MTVMFYSIVTSMHDFVGVFDRFFPTPLLLFFCQHSYICVYIGPTMFLICAEYFKAKYDQLRFNFACVYNTVVFLDMHPDI